MAESDTKPKSDLEARLSGNVPSGTQTAKSETRAGADNKDRLFTSSHAVIRTVGEGDNKREVSVLTDRLRPDDVTVGEHAAAKREKAAKRSEKRGGQPTSPDADDAGQDTPSDDARQTSVTSGNPSEPTSGQPSSAGVKVHKSAPHKAV